MNALLVAVVLAAGNGESPPVEAQQARPMIVSGAVLLGAGGLGLVAGGLTFLLENVTAAALPVVPAATPNHTASAILFAVSGAAAVSGAVLLIVGLNRRAQPGLTSWWAPTLLPTGGLGLSWGVRF